jgi:DNA-binding response OmpR family regulator
VVQQSSGQITVQSELLVGTSFDILLPRDNAPVGITTPPLPVAPLPVTRGSERVLLLEADHVVRKMVAGILTADGYRVYASATAVEALSLAKEATQPIQLFIAPLADTGAGTVAHTLLARRAETRLLDIGSAEAKHPFTSLSAKQFSRLPKPFALSELLKASRQLLDT